jgi:hypothetical protein
MVISQETGPFGQGVAKFPKHNYTCNSMYQHGHITPTVKSQEQHVTFTIPFSDMFMSGTVYHD